MRTLPTTVKLAIVLDCTASMQTWIDDSVTMIRDTVASTLASHPTSRVEVALVAYRDYGDAVRHHRVDFTTPDEIERVLRNLDAEGGDDDAEDVAGAFECARSLTWEHSEVRMLVHITDAPAHGRQFHGPRVSDRFPDGDPEGRDPVHTLVCLAAQWIDITFVRITSRTDRMIDVFREAMAAQCLGQLRVIDLHSESYEGQGGSLSYEVTQAVSDAVSRYTSSQDR